MDAERLAKFPFVPGGPLPLSITGGEGSYLFTGDGRPPGFVYGIIVSIFLFFNSFALNQWLQYREVGRWRDYVYGERAYIILSFVAKSALAWQLYANVLIPTD